MKRKMIQYVTTMIDETGIKVTKENAENGKIWRLITLAILMLLGGLSTGMFSLVNYDDFYKFVSPVPCTAAIIICCCGTLTIFVHRDKISEMLYALDTNLYTYPDEHRLNMRYSWYLEEEKVTKIMTAALCFEIFTVIVIFIPIIGELVTYHRISTFVYPSWQPWIVDDLRSELVVAGMQMIQSFCGLWFYHIVVMATSLAVFEFLRQYERLTTACLSLKRRTEESSKAGETKSAKYDTLMRRNIVHCIKHHQILHKNFQLLRIWFSVFYSCELAVCMVSFAFVLYVLINTTSLPKVLNFMAVTFIINMNFLTRCFAGEIFADLNDNLAYTLFSEVDWCELSKENQRLLVIFHRMACRPHRLFGLGIFEATRKTFAQIIRSTYSSFNLLNMMLKKRT
ncbi:uncharacterized protein LOC135848378 [Planococcus citri]|uniref:uncharacterized protein LOC135848378 n=1 Tax=Planococcus citri TaxID=170843 RepID=UPI0031F7C425